MLAQHHANVSTILERADQFASEEQYSLALQEYNLALSSRVKTSGLCYKLAECYRKTFNYEKAQEFYDKAAEEDESSALAIYYQGLMRKYNGRVTEAISYFDQFITRFSGDALVAEYIEQAAVDKAGCEMVGTSKSAETSAELLPAGINSPYNDYAPAAPDSNSLVISSERLISNRSLIDDRYGEGFSDNYLFIRKGGKWTDLTRKEFQVTNSKFHDGSGSFTRNSNKYYFTKCDAADAFCKIYVSYFSKDKWNEPVLLNQNINTPKFDSKQPAISGGGDTLYFVSNRPGGYGLNDIWFSVNYGNEDWGPAINLGPKINTKLNEVSPGTSPFKTILFFASAGHQGFGGLDLYMAKRLSSGDTVLYNLGAPYNTSRDDCFLDLNSNNVYWSSNRTGGIGGFDVYAASIASPIAFVSKVSLRSPSGRSDVKLKSRAVNNEKVNLIVSGNEERIDYHALSYEKKKIVDLIVEHKMRHKHLPEFPEGTSEEEINVLIRVAEERYRDRLLQQQLASTFLSTVDLPRDSLTDFTIIGVVSDSLSGSAFQSLKLILTDEYGEILKITRTNELGQFRFTDVPHRKQLFIRSEKLKPGDNRKPIVSKLRTPEAIRASELYAENIYFDFDQYIVRPEASKVLDELALFLKSNPGVQLEVFAFADDRGSMEYNLQLTQRRGQAVLDYLTQKGVDQTALAVVPKGKQLLQTDFSDIERQYNRRVEFYLNGTSGKFPNHAKTYIARKQTYWSTLSKELGIEEDKLRAMNGASSEFVKPYQPIRLPANTIDISEELFFVGL